MGPLMPIGYLLAWFGAVFAASYLINWLLVRSIIRRYYRLFVAPGVIVHELSHALGCLITGAEIVEINFWKPSGGHVKHRQPTNPRWQIIAEPIIALAPIWGTLILLLGLSRLLIPDLFSYLTQAPTASLINSLNLGDWHTWLYLYLVTSLIATMAPSGTDLRYALASLVVLALVLIALLFIPGFNIALVNWAILVRPFAIFILILMVTAIVIAFLLALPNRHRHFVARNQLE